ADPAVDDALYGVARAVDGDDLDVTGLLAGALQRGHRAQAHLVVLRVDALDAGLGLDELLGDLLALLAGEVTGLLEDDLQAGSLLGDALLEALSALGGDVVPGRAQQDGDLALAAGG